MIVIVSVPPPLTLAPLVTAIASTNESSELWWILILPLPIVVRYFLRPVSEVKQAALRMPFLADFISVEGHGETDAMYGMIYSMGWRIWQGKTRVQQPFGTIEPAAVGN